MPIHSAGDVLLKRYRIEQFLNEGGMQEVYKATDLTFDRNVALKVPKSPSAEKRFHRSAKMSARVTHPNVAKTLDYFEEDKRYYLVEELVAGIDLRQRFDKEFVFLDPYLAARVFHRLARGVSAAHRAKVFHRDLKPSNVMVSDDPHISEIKITDFGIAKMAEEEFNEVISQGGDDSITGSKTVLGAIPYMAPEMFDSPKKASQPADVWALGAMLFHLSAGVPPFGIGLVAVKAIVQGELPEKPSVMATRSCSQKLSDELWQLVQQCLQMDPKKRPTAEQLAISCSSLCYSTATRQAGTVSSFGSSYGDFGRIAAESGETIFFHRRGFHGGETPKPGQPVNFACYPGTPNARAHPVLSLKLEDD